MGSSVAQKTTEDKKLDAHRAYALLEKEENLLLLLKHFSENNADVQQIFEAALDIKNRNKRIKTLLEDTSQESDLRSVLDHLDQTDSELTELKTSIGETDQALSAEIDKHRVGIRSKEKLKKAFSALVPSTVGITVGLSDPSYMGYLSSGSPGGGGGGGISMPSSPVFQQVKNISEMLLSAHFGLIAQVIYGLAIIINFMMSELSSAKRLDQNIQTLTKKNSGFALRFKKNMLVVGLFLLRFLVLGITIGLTVTAILTPIGSAVLLLVGLSSYLFEEFRHLSLEKAALAEMREKIKKEKREDKMTLCDKCISDPNNTVAMRLENIKSLAEYRLLAAKDSIAMGLLETKLAVSLGRRNKTLYSATGATFIILSFAFPPFFFLGLTMLAVPLLVGAAWYADEKLNKGRFSHALANSRLARFVTNSAVYKKVFDNRPSSEQNSTELNDLSLIPDSEIPQTSAVPEAGQAERKQADLDSLGLPREKALLLSGQLPLSPGLKTPHEKKMTENKNQTEDEKPIQKPPQ